MDTSSSQVPDVAVTHELVRARLEVATEAAQLGLWDWDLTTDALQWDARSRTLYGQDDMPLTGLVSDFARTVHPDDQAPIAELLQRAIAERGTLEAEFRTVHPDGSERILYARGQVLVDASGAAVRMVGTNSDVTELRRAQRQTAQDAERLGRLVEVARALGDAETEQAVLEVVNGAASEVFGASSAALVLHTGEPGPRALRTLTSAYDEAFGASVAFLPADVPLPAVHTATTGTSWFVTSRAEAPAAFAAGAPIWAASGTDAVGCVPLFSDDGVAGALSIGFPGPRPWREPDRALLTTFGSLTAQALRRIWARTAELRALHSARQTAAQQTALVALAQSLELAESEEGVLAVIAGGGVGLLGACGAVLCLHSEVLEDGGLRALTARFSDGAVRADVSELPAGVPLPMVDAAATGRAHFLPDRAAALALFPGREQEVAELLEAAGTHACAALALTDAGVVVGSLALFLDRDHTWTSDEQALVRAFTALAATALSRIHAQEAERAANAAVRRFSETLQRSLLTRPPEPDHLHLAVRYLPAAAEAQVGGDWYDAFMVGDGATSIVVGDVTGHDREAAAAMGQMRNLLRGIAHVSGAEPAQVLSSLDAAVRDLDVGAMATVLLVKVVQTPEMKRRGERLLRWSNAGHPPPLLVGPDGRARYLESEPELLIGLAPDVPRTAHEVPLEPGSTLLLFSDGLVERRGAPLDEGLAWLAHTVEGLHEATVEEICDELLRQVGAQVEDDVAIVALRAYPEDAPRPPEAGPEISPVS
ncbi:PAS domain S-box-containing protein [Quadrisphaera granulorum]|uniref:protein-serine/threonine phosphatase n=1 Tax=Quadrisphaera granulorum TaxID=317664 RepID=A0A316A6F3_9ACTN|nr:SpoIIE family protein phosphatase [Quadrisphaera granulorum]PWJ52818.1 PAS domain S-box-containing protein [Quadrisphaera granulorum]SZE97423.1 PAS domain S-box-containing protein [Quadrisphaera granulorum]